MNYTAEVRDGWFAALGKPVPPDQILAASLLLQDNGVEPVEANLTCAFTAREIRHDNPEQAYKIMRGTLGSNETLVLMALATLVAPVVKGGA